MDGEIKLIKKKIDEFQTELNNHLTVIKYETHQLKEREIRSIEDALERMSLDLQQLREAKVKLRDEKETVIDGSRPFLKKPAQDLVDKLELGTLKMRKISVENMEELDQKEDQHWAKLKKDFRIYFRESIMSDHPDRAAHPQIVPLASYSADQFLQKLRAGGHIPDSYMLTHHPAKKMQIKLHIDKFVATLPQQVSGSDINRRTN